MPKGIYSSERFVSFRLTTQKQTKKDKRMNGRTRLERKQLREIELANARRTNKQQQEETKGKANNEYQTSCIQDSSGKVFIWQN